MRSAFTYRILEPSPQGLISSIKYNYERFRWHCCAIENISNYLTLFLVWYELFSFLLHGFIEFIPKGCAITMNYKTISIHIASFYHIYIFLKEMWYVDDRRPKRPWIIIYLFKSLFILHTVLKIIAYKSCILRNKLSNNLFVTSKKRNHEFTNSISLLYLAFYFPFLFGLLFPFFIWTSIFIWSFDIFFIFPVSVWFWISSKSFYYSEVFFLKNAEGQVV